MRNEMEHRPDLIVKNIGVDTGGTFTDIVMRIDGDLFTHKVLSTPQNPALAVLQGVREIVGGVCNPDSSTPREIVGGVCNPDSSTPREIVGGVCGETPKQKHPDSSQGVSEIVGEVCGETPKQKHPDSSQGVSEIVGGVCNPDFPTDTDTEQLDIVHGSTVATNALLERRGARIALVTTKDFEDILEIGRQARPNLYDFFVERPNPLVPADRRFGISERTLHTGEIQTEIAPSDLEALASELATLELDAIAVCFLFAYVNPQNEQIVAKHLSRLGIPISCSHEVLPEYREYARFSTTVANAYIRPTLERHISTLIDSEQFPTSFRLMLSNGGCVSAKIFQRSLQAENLRYRGESVGIRTVLSGPAGGVIGAYQVAKAAGYDRIITFDMGGTSTDVSLCNGGISLTTESTISGLPIKVPLIDIHTVGAGGGSIATVDTGGALRVGPESAGADPGPICYGNNGEDVTVTDANLYLGRIAATQFLGGAMSLDSDKTRIHIEEFAKHLGVPPMQAADGILKVANAAMERAIKVISVERGFDTRDFTLVSFGGAGGLHAAFMAENLGIETVLIPPNGGLLSAYGMLFADVVKDYSQTVLWQFEKNSEDSTSLVDALNAGFDALSTRAENEMKSEGFVPQQLKIDRSLDMRYQGQSYELTIPCLTAGPASSTEVVETLVERFHAAHEQRFGYARTDAPVEVVNLRLTATGETDKPPIESIPLVDADASKALTVRNPVIFEGEALATDFYRREALRPGNRIAGPSVVTEFSATTVIPPNFSAVVDAYQNLILAKK